MGVGFSLRKLTASKLASALEKITSDVKIHENARLLGEKIRSENGVATAIQYIYRDLDYAKERIKDIYNQHHSKA